uniref:DUF4455 domain-containing protein n=1 Tax=Globisporangium ultimum (strain ATCC 200006 / CBS 805.95 / DAOM BR144) TaxID=431595 RepID=K3WAI1_GLOUD
MALKSRAEMQLLQVLNQHKAKSASFYLKEQQQKAQQDDVDKQHFTATHDLAQYRKANRKHDGNAGDEDNEMIAQVRQLQGDFYVVGDPQNQDEVNEQPSNEIIALNAIARREKHMMAQQQYTEHVKQISEDIEVAIIQAADLVKEALANSDSRLCASEQTLTDEDLLLRSTHEDVVSMWSAMEQICTQRTQLITQFAQTLDTIERTRTSRVRNELQTLTAVLMDTAHALPPEIERIIEAEAYELNVVVISNRNVYADLIARMAMVDVDVFVATRLAWENGQRRWRQIRHHDAIRRYQDTMNSTLFTDPDERLEIVREIRMFQERVHTEKRLAALTRLEAAGAQLASDTANEILATIRATQVEEEDQNHAFFARLMAVHVDKANEAQLMREHLRLEIHGFGALAEEGDIAYARDHLAATLNTDTLEEFFRMAGGLRSELDSIVKHLCTADLIYEANLQPLTTSLQVLLSTLPLESVMEAQGKGVERKALQATLEKMRKAGKHDILALLPPLHTQTMLLANLTNMSEVFQAEVQEIVAQLDQLILEYGVHERSEIDGKLTDVGIASGLSTMMANRPQSQGTTLHSSMSAATATTASSHGPTSSPPKSKPSESLGLIPTTSSNVTIDLLAIRKVQRRLGALLYASELGAPIQDHLGFISDQLALQSSANGVVDEVINKACNELLDARHQESRIFLESMGKEMEHQSARLHDQTEKLTTFCLRVAQCMEQSVEKFRYIDLSAMDLLDHLKDDNEEVLAELEVQFLESCARVRHAPNEIVLQQEFQVASTLLQQMEAQYRIHHRKGNLAAAHHVITIERHHALFLDRLLESFGLAVVQQPASSDTNEDALDVGKFLSTKYIEDIVNPPPPPQPENEEQADGVETNPQEGLDGKGSGTTPRTDIPAAHPETKHQQPPQRGGKGLTKASPRVVEEPAVIKEMHRTSSGLDTKACVTIPALVARILSQNDDVEDNEEVETIKELETVGDADPIPTTHDPAATQSTADDATADEIDIEAAATHELRQRLVIDKVAVAFLRLEIPAAVMEHLVATLREEMVSKYDDDSKLTKQRTAATREERLADGNLLLEERLRMHWPRNGRLDVQMYQPRVGELVSHRQRLERQLRSVRKKVETQESVFAKHAQQALDQIEQVRVKQISCHAQLPMQSSLAALQGLEGKSKKLLKAFQIENADKLDALHTMIKADVTTLVSSMQDFVRTCSNQQFPELTSYESIITGCDYHPEEVAGVNEKIMAVEAQLREKIQARELQINEIVAQSQTQVLDLAQTFKARYQACMQSLSMKDGLGQKYGLPRRIAQERYRSEVTRCDEQSAKTDELLAALHVIVLANNESTQHAKPVAGGDGSRTILRMLLQLRAKMYVRGRYFGLLKNISQLEPTPVEFNSSGNSIHVSEQQGHTFVLRDRDIVDEQDQQLPTPFLEFVQDVSARCREDTRQVYQQEGKLEELPNGSVPPSLEEYLLGLADKARSYVLQQELKFCEQVHFFEELLALAPEAALVDLLNRSSEALRQRSESVAQELEREYAALTEQKDKHMEELRPELCSPNNADQLQALRDREASRSQHTVARLRYYRTQVMDTHVGLSADFENELVALFRCFMTILDTCVMTLDDLKPFSGDELPKLKRKSLKRLRKVARILEFGDAREVKRTDKELESLTQRGEVPRFPKRSWPAIPNFGLRALWDAQHAQILRHDEEQKLPSDDTIQALGLGTSNGAVADEDAGASVGLLTHAHRSLVGMRDTMYASYAALCKTQSEQMLDAIHEKLCDELKSIERWNDGIDAMHST